MPLLHVHLYMKDDGASLLVDGHTVPFRGTVSIVCADNPASTLLGGFKQSASAFRCCRHCMGGESDIQSKVCISN